MAIRRPSQIQIACIPQILKGRDCIGGARTGSGKTIAFAAPILEKLAEDPFGVFALVLTPTRELALQISEQFAALGASMNLKQAVIVGGMDMVTQGLALQKRPHVVVATPGRLADHISSSGEEAIAGLRRVQVLVLDEADRLLTPGFAEDLEVCMGVMTKAKNRQTLLFSATVSQSVMQLKESSKNDIFIHEVGSNSISIPDTLGQTYLFIPKHVREAYLVSLLTLPLNERKSAIVFVNRATTAEVLKRVLRIMDVRVTSLHAQLSQRERMDSLGRFRAEAARVLVATDVASRGLDIPVVQMVINFDIPADPDDYIHRVGRTARAGRAGESISFVTEHDIVRIKAIEERVGKVMIKYEHVTESMVIRDSLQQTSNAKREALMDWERENSGSSRRKRKFEQR
ncbi:P-loop containing nucleoside triphosphate hydrolase protein [Lipomyces tetrasporus]|uniref:P-loop containing nucleoside triphosphate hydrolase protein n=1 Tax=Lipomyces tetrasporus TaxID=54092 RepID=A0AAD7VSA1_9ASCO|nr:P-loop containing nucleoside triphosphate hydrolase protein [Lipomyces tetrasporus]KAJ8100118.1 P-loop containing nucleoside triphosphate hydrolase protein [Lipomyces tetrasporus]